MNDVNVNNASPMAGFKFGLGFGVGVWLGILIVMILLVVLFGVEKPYDNSNAEHFHGSRGYGPMHPHVRYYSKNLGRAVGPLSAYR